MNASIQNNSLSVRGSSRSMGDILVATGRLSPDDADKISARQKQDGVPFGEAAIALRLLTKADIDFALSKQFNYAYLAPTDLSLSAAVVTAYKPFSTVSENMRAVRSQLMLRWFNGEPLRKVLAVVSPGKQEGRSFVAANLAVVFSQQGQRTLLIDGDMRSTTNNNQQGLFRLPRGHGLSSILADRATFDAVQAVPGLPGLTVLQAGAIPPNPQELLGRPSFGGLLMAAIHEFDVVLIDTPSGTDFSDAEIIAARAGAAILVTRKNQSLVPSAGQLSRRLQDVGVAVVGAVLNDA